MIEVYKSDRVPPEVQRPAWLAGGALDGSLPISELMSDSVYYPASGLDGDPMMHLGHHFWIFVYADYGYDHQAVIGSFSSSRFAGYSVIGRRTVDESELPLERWNVETSGFLAGGNNREARLRDRLPFAEWALLERNYGPDKPREFMSLLFIGADGVTLLQRLYVENRATPACVAIIQPSDEMGGSNWTDFRNPNGVFARTLAENPAGSPRYLIHGGDGKPEWYRETCWPAYSQCLAWPLRRTHGRPMEGLERNRREGALSFWERAT